MKKLTKSPLVIAIGTAVVSSLAMSTVNAATNPFGMSEMSQGYMQLAKVVPFEGSAPASTKAATEAATPAPAEKPAAAPGEMKCGANMKMDGAAETATPKKVDGSCGEGKCGAMMDGDKMKKGMESVCGAMMKGKEGACGNAAKDAAAPKMDDMKGMEGMTDGKAKSEMSCGASMKKENGEMACGAMMNGGAAGADGKAVEAKCAAKK